MRTKATVCLAVWLGLFLVCFSSAEAQTLRLATGSPCELGLVDALFNEFRIQTPGELVVTKAGSGASLALLKEGKVDLVMVHAPASEEAALKEGWARHRTSIGGNDFVIVGPEADPAEIKGCDTVLCAYRRIAEKQSPFISRGDNSGTHKKELQIWQQAGIEPQGAWYVTHKDFMMATLLKAGEQGAYFMTDRSTYIVAKKQHPDLKLAVLFQGDPVLVNHYHALTTSPDLYPQSNYALAKQFVEFMAGEKGQSIISAFGKKEYGEPLYFPAAGR